MVALLSFLLLFAATGTALRLDERHRPIAFAFVLFVVADHLSYIEVPSALAYAGIITPPVAIVAAAWTSLHPEAREHFGLICWVLGPLATFVAMVAERFNRFGHAMGYLWVFCACISAVALYQSKAPWVTRSAVIALVLGLPVEAVGWMAWKEGVDGPYAFARAISMTTFAVIIAFQTYAVRARDQAVPAVTGRSRP